MDSCEYQLTIKSANQKVDDYVISCRSIWTVQRLKQHIAETHVCKPSVEEQRLIYAGNLLKDSQILKQIFFRDSLCTELTNSNKTDFTIHLVCSSPKYTTSEPIKANKSRSAPNIQSQAPAPQPTSSTSTSIPVDSSRFRTSGQESGLNEAPTNTAARANRDSSGSAPTPSAQSTTTPSQASPTGMASQAEVIHNLLQSDQMRQQMAVFQQLAYVVAAQLVDSLNNNNVNLGNITANSNSLPVNRVPTFAPLLNGQPLNLHVSTPPVITNHLNVPQMLYAGPRPRFVTPSNSDARAGVHQNENINNENNRPGVGEQVPGQFNFAGQMQAQAPVVEQPAPAPQQADPDVALLQHDVIDWVYYSIRAIVLMAALYIHASMFRLLFLLGLLAIAFFFNRRSGRRPSVHVNRVANERRQHQPAQDLHGADGDRLDGQEVAEDPAPGGENQQENTLNPNTPARLPFLKLCLVVFTDFLASLVPE